MLLDSKWFYLFPPILSICFHVIFPPGCPDVQFGWPNKCGIKLSPQKCEQRASHRALPTPSETGVILCHSAAMGIRRPQLIYSLQWLPVSEHFAFEARLWCSLAIFFPHFHNQTFCMCLIKKHMFKVRQILTLWLWLSSLSLQCAAASSFPGGRCQRSRLGTHSQQSQQWIQCLTSTSTLCPTKNMGNKGSMGLTESSTKLMSWW